MSDEKRPRCVWCKHHDQDPPLTHTCAKGIDIEAMREGVRFALRRLAL